MTKISILNKEGIIEKISSYERRVYESVDVRSLSWVIDISKIDRKINSGHKGLTTYLSQGTVLEHYNVLLDKV